MSSRAFFKQLALEVVGLSADPTKPESRARFLELIAPGESPARQTEMAKMSTCGLVVAGIWRAAGLQDPRIAPPYKTQTAVSRLIVIGIKCGGWTVARAKKCPQEGDMVLVGDNAAGGVEHVYTVTGVTFDDMNNPVLESVDGGQRESGHQCILKKKRVWKSGQDIVFQGSDPGSTTKGGRKIYGWVDCTKLPIPDK